MTKMWVVKEGGIYMNKYGKCRKQAIKCSKQPTKCSQQKHSGTGFLLRNLKADFENKYQSEMSLNDARQ